MINYPGRTKRNSLVSEFLAGEKTEGILAGRIVGVLDGEGTFPGSKGNNEKGFILQDWTGRLVIMTEERVNPGDIVEIEVKHLKSGVAALRGKINVLSVCEDFYIAQGAPAYLRAIVDQNVVEKIHLRRKIIKDIRGYFEREGFLEIDTPSLVKFPGQEPYLDLFKTEFQAKYEGEDIKENLYLISSPEYSLKKYLVAGFEKIFQLTPAFRNKETFSDRHNPEFLLLEWYRAYASYLEIMNDTEKLVKDLAGKFCGGIVKFGGKEIDVMQPWDRISVGQAFEKFAGIPANALENFELLKIAARQKGYQVAEEDSFDDLFFKIFLNEIEPHLGAEKPVIIFDYPISMAALSKPSEANPRFAERFELYIGGLEICNAFTELNDPVEQERRLLEEKALREKMGKDIYGIDQKFIGALKMGMPPSGGNALGVDRLIMLLTGEERIENILPIPYKDL